MLASPLVRRPLPPFGRELARSRDQSHHPARVWVIVGNDWGRRPQDAPSLCVEADHPPASYDWSVLAGLAVHVVRRDEAAFGPAKHQVAEEGRPLSDLVHHALDRYLTAGMPAPARREAAYNLSCEQPMRIASEQFREVQAGTEPASHRSGFPRRRE
jgi:hypothetical protein